MAKLKIDYYTADTVSQIITLLEIEGADTSPVLDGIQNTLIKKEDFPVVIGRFSRTNNKDGYMISECSEELKKILKDNGACYTRYFIKVVRNSKTETELIKALIG